jgi:hypothetical protein
MAWKKASSVPVERRCGMRTRTSWSPKAQQHAKELHGMELTREQALAMAKPA